MLLYFAYGSNMHPLRLEERIGAHDIVGAARLPGHRLMFHKRGRDGSGKCDAWHTGDPAHVVHGVLYRIGAPQKSLLDRIEGVGRGYEAASVTVHNGQGECRALAYRAQPAHIDPAARPFSWYHALVVHGARYHRLPRSYVDAIAVVEALDDPDTLRQAQHLDLLRGLERLDRRRS